ncbi:MAG: NAD(P)-binding domain-containing protein [Cyclobacteriaceae bacterium]|nr:NAD(P)-binding domain-containing protein [Cyclobacteriaceae bacterium]
MKIAIIGTGNVGSALAKGFAKAGHQVLLGVRNKNDFKGSDLANEKNISVQTISEAASFSDVVLIAAVPQAAKEIAAQLGDMSNKVIIDAMNSVRVKPEPFSNTTEALMNLTNCKDIVKCFNTTGAENMSNPIYHGRGIDLFYAGDSEKAKKVAEQLAKDVGFENVYNFGGSDKFNLLEQFAISWINLAMMQGYGRGIAVKILKR